MITQTEEQKQLIEERFEGLLEKFRKGRSEEDVRQLKLAFEIANEAHKGMLRKSGEPYIIHPIEVAKIAINEIGLGATAAICALLHDVVEDTTYELSDIERNFNKKIASIIDGLTKISVVFEEGSIQAENFRKMLLTLSDDVRVILIKLADRLHNMRTLSSLEYGRQIKIASETLYIYAPLAHRLGLYSIKTELEDLSLKYQHPGVYEEISKKLKDSEEKRNKFITRFALPIIDKLNENGIDFTISGRPKSVFSIWKKMQNKGIPFEEVYDLFAIRIVFNSPNDLNEKNLCWNIYSLITDVYKPNPDRLRDWVNIPKANGYEALHSTLMSKEGRWVEVQIRSKRMDEIAERGYAAHWKYKGDNSDSGQLDEWLRRIREMLDNPQPDALDFMDDFKMNLFSSEIFVFTPKGKLVRLPKDVTVLDFAYEIHSEIGNHAIGAKVNLRLVPLSYRAQSGDQIEILTSEKQKPQIEWLEFVKTAKSKNLIKDAFKEERKEKIMKGKEILENKLKEMNVSINHEIFKKLLIHFKITSKEELFINLASNTFPLDNLKKIVNKKQKNKLIRYWQIQFTKTTHRVNKSLLKKDSSSHGKHKTAVEEIDDKKYIIAKCCHPIPGDNIIGFLNKDNTIVIHQKKCPTVIRLLANFAERIVTAEWKTQKINSYLTKIKMNGIDRFGLVNEISGIISHDFDVNMQSINFDSFNGIFEGSISLYVHDKYDLDNLLNKLSKIKGIKSAVRDDMPEEGEI